MTNPAIQNDFSYYRRTISRNRLNNQQVRTSWPPFLFALPSSRQHALFFLPVFQLHKSETPSFYIPRLSDLMIAAVSKMPVVLLPPQLEAENEVNNEMANRMSLFYAEATPMLKTLSNATTKFVSEVGLQF